jgi:REP element-mobilizing transposase RayT
MANTYHKIYIQTVFPVKYREALLDKTWRNELIAVIGNLINETGCKTIIINGVEDHINCFFCLKPSISVSDVMKNAKAKSSKWINESGYLNHHFEWQQGFGVFSYSQSHIDQVFRYIQNQEAHHKKRTFKEEYLDMLHKFEIDYNEEFIFNDLL